MQLYRVSRKKKELYLKTNGFLSETHLKLVFNLPINRVLSVKKLREMCLQVCRYLKQLLYLNENYQIGFFDFNKQPFAGISEKTLRYMYKKNQIKTKTILPFSTSGDRHWTTQQMSENYILIHFKNIHNKIPAKKNAKRPLLNFYPTNLNKYIHHSKEIRISE